MIPFEPPFSCSNQLLSLIHTCPRTNAHPSTHTLVNSHTGEAWDDHRCGDWSEGRSDCSLTAGGCGHDCNGIQRAVLLLKVKEEDINWIYFDFVILSIFCFISLFIWFHIFCDFFWILNDFSISSCDRMFLGSTSHYCMNHSKIPVLVVPPNSHWGREREDRADTWFERCFGNLKEFSSFFLSLFLDMFSKKIWNRLQRSWIQ